MLAFAVVIAVFSFWSIVGLALVSRLYSRRNLLQNVLLAPITGLVATALLVTWINCAGVPVRYGGPAATLFLVILAAWLLRRYRPVIPVRRLLPFAGVLLLAAVAIGHPMFRYGFNWISYANNDMASYCLGAKLFLNNGHFDVPDANAVIEDRDVSLLEWFGYVVVSGRHGVQEVLAWLSSMTGLAPLPAFMPLIVAFHLVLITAVGALVLQSRKHRYAALLTCFTVSVSALTALGTMYQLLGQVGGLATLAGAGTVLLRRQGGRKSEMVLGGLLAAGAGVLYPEILPFLGLSYILHHSVLLFRKRETLNSLVARVWPLAIFFAIFQNAMLIVSAMTVIRSSGSGMAGGDVTESLFPFYLTPAGFAYIWGFHTIGTREVGLVLDIGIVIGAVLFFATSVGALGHAWRGNPAAGVFLVMLVLTLQLFKAGSDFGLYKIAMFIQPFLLGTLSIIYIQLFRWFRNSFLSRSVLVCLFGAVVCWGARTHFQYTRLSLGNRPGGTFVEIPYASAEGLVPELNKLPKETTETLVSDTPNVVLARLQSLYRGPTYFTAADFHRVGLTKQTIDDWNPYSRIYRNIATELSSRRASQFAVERFNMHGALPSANSFRMRLGLPKSKSRVIESGARTTVLNRRAASPDDPLMRLVSKKDQRNRLMFVVSDFGNSYYLAGRASVEGRVSMYQLEPDYFFSGESMASLGRDSLFLISNPSSSVRMVVEYTASLNSDRANLIHGASVIGDQRYAFAAEGRGSARLFSPPLRPQQIDGGQYIALDMGTWGFFFPQTRSRIMSLWGTRVLNDRRRIVGFARDISLISNEEYEALIPPHAIQWFPGDLKNKNLEYSGIYEDGWVAESSYFVLTKPQSASSLVVSLSIPILQGLRASSWATLELDGKEVGKESTASGVVSFKVPVQGSGKHRIELRFDRADTLPAPDTRPVSAQIQYIGFRTSGSN